MARKEVMAVGVFCGGIIGTWLRAGTDVLLHEQNMRLASYLTFSYGIFVVNLVGAFLLGFMGIKWEYQGLIEAHHGIVKSWAPVVRTGVTTGCFGALTTYSSLSLIVAHNHLIWDSLALVALFIVGIMVAGWGRKLARKIYAPRYHQVLDGSQNGEMQR